VPDFVAVIDFEGKEDDVPERLLAAEGEEVEDAV
jgi:hypothetical protein